MIANCLRLAAIIIPFLHFTVFATPHYVDVNGTNATPPFLDWSTAATNIQDAVDVAVAGDQILVANGVYRSGGKVVSVAGATTNRVAVTAPLAIQSMNGPEFTVIQGYQVPGTTNGNDAVRCVYLTNGASLSGFTMNNGATKKHSNGGGYGGGVWCQSTDPLVSNCVINGNAAFYAGGGVYRGTLNNCTLISNSVSVNYGGGAYQSTLKNCAVTGNFAKTGGGGVSESTLNSCTINSNSANVGGGTELSTLSNCTLTGNSAGTAGGTYGSTLNNCTLSGNTAYRGGAAAGEAMFGICVLNNCTITGNSATESGGGAFQCTLKNCIVYFNTAALATNYDRVSILRSCCTTPVPPINVNITNAPLFVDSAGGNFHLQGDSPCINSGNNAYVTTSKELDGNPRIVNGTVDIGAFEYLGNGSQISYAWLQQYGWPTDGSADALDPDADGMSNWQEWSADTIPTNALSVLRMVNITNDTTGLKVTWQSVPTRTYWLDRASNLASLPSFSGVVSNIVGQVVTTTYKDSTATNGGPYFYRVGVQ